MIETEDVRLSQERLEALKELINPIKDLAKNWNVDISIELEKFMSGFTVSQDGGGGHDNFAEAALVIQGSAGVYSKKVELLYSLVVDSLDLVAEKQKKGKKGGEDDDGGEGGGDSDGEDETMTLGPVNLSTSAKVRVDIKPFSRGVHYKTRLPLCLTPALTKRDLPENNIFDRKRGELVATYDDFFSTTSLINKHGCAAFDIHSAMFFAQQQKQKLKAMTPFFKRRVSQYDGFARGELRERGSTPGVPVLPDDEMDISIGEPPGGDNTVAAPEVRENNEAHPGESTTAAPMVINATLGPTAAAGMDDDDGGEAFGVDDDDDDPPPSFQTPIKHPSLRSRAAVPLIPTPDTSKIDCHLDPYAELPVKPFKKGVIEKPSRGKRKKAASGSLSTALKLDKRSFRKPVSFPNILRKPIFEENIELFKATLSKDKKANTRLKNRLIAKPPALPLPSDLLQVPEQSFRHPNNNDDDDVYEGAGGADDDDDVDIHGTIVDDNNDLPPPQPDHHDIHSSAVMALEESQREALTTTLTTADIKLSYGDLVKEHVSKFTDEARSLMRVSELRERVLAWENTISPILDTEEGAVPYEIQVTPPSNTHSNRSISYISHDGWLNAVTMATLQFTNMPTNRGVPTAAVVPDLLFGDFTQSEVESIIKQSVLQQDSEAAAPLSFGSFSCEEVSQLVTSSHDLKNVVDFEFEGGENGAVDSVSPDDPSTTVSQDYYSKEDEEEVRLPVITSSVIGEVSHIPSPIFPSLNLSADSGIPILSTPEKADINDVMHRLIEEAVKSSNFAQPPENNFAQPPESNFAAAAAPTPWSTQPDMSWSDNQLSFNSPASTVQEQTQEPWITAKKPAAPSASVWSNNHHPWTSMFKDTAQPQTQPTQEAVVPQAKLPQILSETRPIVSSKDHELMMLGSQLQLMTITHSETVPLIPRGLINKSTNCFAHAPLQALLVSPLYHVIRQLNPNYTVSPVLCAVKSFFDSYRLMSGIYANFDSPFEPTSIYEMLRSKIPSFNENGRQEDAEEFLGIILSNLHDEMVSAIRSAKKTVSLPLIVDQEEDGGEWQQIGKKKRIQVTRNTSNNETSPVSELFGGLTRSVVTKAGAKESATLQPFLSLQLDIQNPSISTVEDALLNFTHREQITLNEVKCYRRETLESLPPVLILHLKRFIYDEAAKSCQKLHKEINFGVQMTIQNEMLSPGAAACGGREYRLFGVVYHHGSHAAGGHYTAMTYHQSLMSWIYHDDEKVQTQFDKAVLKHVPGRSAYLLFYKRIN
eukprot:sb/3461141/